MTTVGVYYTADTTKGMTRAEAETVLALRTKAERTVSVGDTVLSFMARELGYAGQDGRSRALSTLTLAQRSLSALDAEDRAAAARAKS